MRRKRSTHTQSSKDWEMNVHVVVEETENVKKRVKEIRTSNYPSSLQEKNAESKTRENVLEAVQYDAYFVPKFDIFVKYIKEDRKQIKGKNRKLRNRFVANIEGLDQKHISMTSYLHQKRYLNTMSLIRISD